jgi:large subunit ribosomal protein L1
MAKKYKKALETYDRTAKFSVNDACALIGKLKISTKWDETVDVSVRLGVNPKYADQMVRGSVVMPAGTGKTKRVLVIAKPDKAKEALEAGADFAGSDEYINKIKDENWFDFDTLVATPDMMVQVGKIGRVLGPRGLMPNPKVGTVTADVSKAVASSRPAASSSASRRRASSRPRSARRRSSPRRSRRTSRALLDHPDQAQAATAKGTYMRSITISTTHGPGIKVDTARVHRAGVRVTSFALAIGRRVLYTTDPTRSPSQTHSISHRPLSKKQAFKSCGDEWMLPRRSLVDECQPLFSSRSRGFRVSGSGTVVPSKWREYGQRTKSAGAR